MQNQSTIYIFDILCNQAIAFVPSDLAQEIQATMEEIENKAQSDRLLLEEVMIDIGKKIWPYKKAFFDMVSIAEQEVGESLLLTKLPPKVRRHYEEYRENGGTLQDFYRGKTAHFFEPDERLPLLDALIVMKKFVYDHVVQQTCSTKQQDFADRVAYYRDVFSGIEDVLGDLYALAEAEQHHELKHEIVSKIKGLEHGLCLLGPEISYDKIKRVQDFFEERKHARLNWA